MKKFLQIVAILTISIVQLYSQDSQCDPCCISLSAVQTIKVKPDGYLNNQPYVQMDCRNCVHNDLTGCSCPIATGQLYGYGLCLNMTSNPTNNLPISPKNMTMNHTTPDNYGCTY